MKTKAAKMVMRVAGIAVSVLTVLFFIIEVVRNGIPSGNGIFFVVGYCLLYISSLVIGAVLIHIST